MTGPVLTTLQFINKNAFSKFIIYLVNLKSVFLLIKCYRENIYKFLLIYGNIIFHYIEGWRSNEDEEGTFIIAYEDCDEILHYNEG
jgi:hypothetical protein